MSEESIIEGFTDLATDDTTTRLTPDGQVAQRIVKRLIDEGLIKSTHAEEIWLSLASGALRSADWRFLAQSLLAEEQRNATSAN